VDIFGSEYGSSSSNKAWLVGVYASSSWFVFNLKIILDLKKRETVLLFAYEVCSLKRYLSIRLEGLQFSPPAAYTDHRITGW